jgi:Leucine-rich repeat (LRR) protein
LFCQFTQIKSLPALPAGLRELDCSNTSITSLPDLPVGLQDLDCSNTPLILQRNDNESVPDYNLRWKLWREEQEELASKQRIQATTRLLKEDIIASAWHPDRFQEWCLDEDEKRENEMLFD